MRYHEPKKHTRMKKRSARRNKTRKTKGFLRFLFLFSLILIVLFAPGTLSVLPPQTEERIRSYVEQEVNNLNSSLTHLFSKKEAGSGPPVTDGSLRVDFLNVGQGLSVLAEADGSFLLYDGGDRDASSYVVSFLKNRGIETLDYVIASHYDSDHINGLVGALHTCQAERFLGPDYSTDTRVFRSLMSRTEEMHLEHEIPAAGTRYPFGQGYFEILGPLSEDYTDVNNYSIVLRLVYGDTSILLTGDAETESEAELIQAQTGLKSDLLCVGHHGSSGSTGEEFLNQADPSYAVISCGKDNSYGHPSETVLERLENRKIPVWRTDENGTVTVISDGTELTITTEFP